MSRRNEKWTEPDLDEIPVATKRSVAAGENSRPSTGYANRELMLAAEDAMNFLKPRASMADLRNGSDASAVYRRLKKAIAAAREDSHTGADERPAPARKD